MLDPLIPGDKKQYEIVFKELKFFPAGEYRAYLTFNVNGKNYGDNLMAKVVIKEKEKAKPEDEFEQNKDKVIEFRDNFGLSEEEYSDQYLFGILRANDYQFDKAFELLFND